MLIKRICTKNKEHKNNKIQNEKMDSHIEKNVDIYNFENIKSMTKEEFEKMKERVMMANPEGEYFESEQGVSVCYYGTNNNESTTQKSCKDEINI